MQLPDRCDVVVIGGGPAGSLAGGLLAAKGYDVVLLEKERFPRLHVGESLIPHFWKYTDLLGASEAITREGFVRKVGGTVVWNGVTRRMGFKDFGYDRPALHVERDRFDALLLAAAERTGARVCTPVAAYGVDLDPDRDRQRVRCRIGAAAETGIECRLVIDASGQRALIGSQLELREIDRRFRFFSVWGYYQGARYVAADGCAHPHEHLAEHAPTTFVTSLPELGDWGWSWHIPLRHSTSVGLVLPLTQMARFKASGQTWSSWLDGQCRTTPLLQDLLDGAQLIEGSTVAIRDYSYRMTRTAGPGFFLVGDAAGFVDPIFSIGIVFGLYSAYSAAWAADRCLRQPTQQTRFHNLYDDQLRRRLEASRALALPNYTQGGADAPAVRRDIGFESLNEQALMNVVATMTTRSGNLDALGLAGPAAAAAAGKVEILDDIKV